MSPVFLCKRSSCLRSFLSLCSFGLNQGAERENVTVAVFTGARVLRLDVSERL